MMEPDPFLDEIPPKGKKARAGGEARSPATQVIWFVALGLVAFSASLAAMRFGPGAVEYIKAMTQPSPRVAEKPKELQVFRPLDLPKSKPILDPEKPLILQPPSIAPMNLRRDNGPGNPNGGGMTSFRITQ